MRAVDADRSLLSSMWQKAIRRGDEQLACVAAKSIIKCDEPYEWRRIRAIAMEDVAMANLELVSQIIAISTKTLLLKRIGSRHALVSMTRQLARSVKCKSGCELLLWRSGLPVSDHDERIFPEIEVHPAGSDDLGTLVDAWLSTECHSIRTKTGWATANKGSPGTRKAWLEKIDAPALVQFVAMRGSGTDRLNTMLPIVWQLTSRRRPHIEAGDHAGDRSPMIGDVPAFAFCMYSKAGRRTLAAIVRETGWGARLRSIGSPSPAKALGSLIFQTEGWLCDRELRVARWREIRRLAAHSHLALNGVPPRHARTLLERARADFDLFNEFRARCVDD